MLSKPINYYTEAAPEIKQYTKKENGMTHNTPYANTDYSFKSISDFKWAMSRGAEIQFSWKGKAYCVFAILTKNDDSPEQMNICEACYEKDGRFYNILSDTEYDMSKDFRADTVQEILDFEINGEKLKDIITKVEVADRTV